ncbi:MAG: hypothetical protein NUV51_07880 [Sulfuricaulis sp.]|nr:hypothetical protein [Sulfuricaulis sp.]
MSESGTCVALSSLHHIVDVDVGHSLRHSWHSLHADVTGPLTGLAGAQPLRIDFHIDFTLYMHRRGQQQRKNPLRRWMRDVVIQRRQTIWQCQSKLVFNLDD